jgi:hypothetical protein
VNDLYTVGSAGDTLPEELVEWRVGMENAVLGAGNVLDVMVLRLALLYGRAGTIWSPFIMPVYRAVLDGSSRVEIPLDARAKPGLVHVDDAAAASFVGAVEKVHLLAGSGVYPVFDLVTSQEGMREIFDALAMCWGFGGEVVLKGHGGDLFAKVMSASFRGSSDRARQLLGWEPKRLNGFVQDMGIFAASRHPACSQRCPSSDTIQLKFEDFLVTREASELSKNIWGCALDPPSQQINFRIRDDFTYWRPRCSDNSNVCLSNFRYISRRTKTVQRSL